MPRQKTGRPLGRPPLYSDDERPVTVSLRIPRDLAAQMKRYASLHRQSVTELLLDGLKMRIGEDDPRDLGLSMPQQTAQGDNEYYGNAEISSDGLRETDYTAVLAEIHAALASQATQLQALAQALEQRPAVSTSDLYYGNTTKAPRRQQNVPEPVREGNGEQTSLDTHNDSSSSSSTVLQEEALVFDPTRFVLGPLCQKQHDYDGQEHSLRQRGGKHECVECKNARSRAHKQRQRQAAQ